MSSILDNCCDIYYCLFIIFHVETKLRKGKEPSKVQLYAHLHCSKVNGKSPIVAQIEAAMKAAEANTEFTDGNGPMESITDESCTEIPDLDVNSLHFTNTDSQAVYVSCITYIAMHSIFLFERPGSSYQL